MFHQAVSHNIEGSSHYDNSEQQIRIVYMRDCDANMRSLYRLNNMSWYSKKALN